MPREAFTHEQWQAITETAASVALAVAAAAGGSGQSEGELSAFLTFVDRSADDPNLDPVVRALATDARAWIATSERHRTDDPFGDALADARKAGALLAVIMEPGEARAIRNWLLEAARVVAAAATEGGVLGIGGEDVSRLEQERIAALADALGSEDW